MLVSAIITTYKNPKFTRALHSALKQSYRDLEIILVDGANDSNVHAKANLYDSVKYIGIENDKGAQNARNIGCQIAKGKYIAMLDDDDEWYINKIQKQIKAAKNQNADMIGCYASVCGYGTQKAMLNPSYEDLLKGFGTGLTSTILIKKSVLEDVGYWRDVMIGPEYDLALRVAKKGYKIITVPEYLIVYNKEMKSKSYSGKSQTYARIAEVFAFWKYYGKDFIPYIGIRGFIYNGARTIGLFLILFYGFIMKKNMTNILDRLKRC